MYRCFRPGTLKNQMKKNIGYIIVLGHMGIRPKVLYPTKNNSQVNPGLMRFQTIFVPNNIRTQSKQTILRVTCV